MNIWSNRYGDLSFQQELELHNVVIFIRSALYDSNKYHPQVF